MDLLPVTDADDLGTNHVACLKYIAKMHQHQQMLHERMILELQHINRWLDSQQQQHLILDEQIEQVKTVLCAPELSLDQTSPPSENDQSGDEN